MTTDPLRAVVSRTTPQTQPADPRQVPNSASGYAFRLDPLAQLRRFLVLGVAGGTYYASARELALENAQVVRDALEADAHAVVDAVVDVSESGRAPRPQPALFVLAMACSYADVVTRRVAFAVLPRVARTPTHLFTFLNYLRSMRGWSKQVNRGVGGWYLSKDLEHLAYQLVKYRQREGWTNRDVLRLAHPDPRLDAARDVLFAWTVGRATDLGVGTGQELLPADDPLRVVEGYERVRRETDPRRAAGLVRDYRLPWEALPDQVINTVPVWEALLEVGVPATALLRQLPRLTRLGLLSPTGAWTPRVVNQLQDVRRLRAGRVHPLQVLVAQRTYASGRSDRGSSTWTPSRPVVDALDAAFYAAFGAVAPTGRRLMLALDVSGSMAQSRIAGTPLSPREASAALALVTAAVEPAYHLVGFTGTGPQHHVWSYRSTPALEPLTLSPRQRLDDAVRYVNGLPFGPTDCALPMLYALEHDLEVDTFVLYTDNESWAGQVHPHEALRRYRERTGIPARLVVVGMTATSFTVADPADAGSLNVVGFDTSTPQLISNFARGEV